MKKMRKAKKMLLILLIAVAIMLIIFGIVKIVKKINEPKEPENKEEVIQLPEIVYSNMQVKNIQLQYLKDQNKTKLSMTIDNTSDQKVVDDTFDAVLIGPDDNVLTTMETDIVGELDVGEQYKVEVILSGDQTATTQIKLIQK